MAEFRVYEDGQREADRDASFEASENETPLDMAKQYASDITDNVDFGETEVIWIIVEEIGGPKHKFKANARTGRYVEAVKS